MSEAAAPAVETPITELSRAQRRVLGVLLEKAFTTPEAYPLTLKATTTGCNQKSNRDPIVNYDEDSVEQVLDELRNLGLVAIVHTDTGRTARYRHYMRKRFTLTEPQLAMLTELLLRGEQSLGDLRGRASRMVPIDSLEQLRTEFAGLMSLHYVRANGPLERRGVLVDHALYPAKENRPMRTLEPDNGFDEDDSPAPRVSAGSAAPAASERSVGSIAGEGLAARLAVLEGACGELRQENQDLHEALATLRDDFRRLADSFEDLRRALGG